MAKNLPLFYAGVALAFTERNQWIADPDFVSVPVDGMLNDEYLNDAKQIKATKIWLRRKELISKPEYQQDIAYEHSVRANIQSSIAKAM